MVSTALNIRTYLEGINIDNLTRSEERKLPLAARDTLPMIDKFIDYESMHLEQYSTLSPSAQRELDYKLSQAEKEGDTKEQALIYCGIYSIESAITAYVKKYAKTKKVKDLVESFQEVLESTQVLARAKTQVATDEEAAKACAKRAAAVKAKIADGKEAEVFKRKIASLNPMDAIEDKAEVLKTEAARKTGRVFEPYGDVITNKEEAGVMETGERILTEYQEKLSKYDLVERKSNLWDLRILEKKLLQERPYLKIGKPLILKNGRNFWKDLRKR